MKIPFFNPLTVALLLLPGFLAGILGSGCAAANPGISNRMASIIVTNHPSRDIDAALRTVFEKHEYVEGRSTENVLIYEKPASFMSGVIYSDWYSGGVWERIKIYQRELDDSRTVVESDGYMVKEHDDPLFSEEKREYKTKRAHIQKLMDETALELANPTAPPTTNAPAATK